MNIKRVLIAGIVMNIVSFVFGGGSYYFFSWIFQLEPQEIWKWTPDTSLSSMPISWLIFLIVGNTILAILYALAYAIFYKGIPGEGIKKGLVFGLVLWPIGVLAPMFSMYVMLNIARGAVIYFSLQGLVECLVYGIVIASIYKEKV